MITSPPAICNTSLYRWNIEPKIDASTPISANEIESPIAIVRGVILLVLVEYAAMSGMSGSIQGDRTLNIPKPKAIRGSGNATISAPPHHR